MGTKWSAKTDLAASSLDMANDRLCMLNMASPDASKNRKLAPNELLKAIHSVDLDLITVVLTDGTGAAITPGEKYEIVVPFALTILSATLVADRSGSIALDLQNCSYAAYDAGATHPVSADSIVAAAPPTISSGVKSQDSTLTGWSTSLAAGSILAVIVSSCTTIQRCTLALSIKRATP